MREVTVMAVMVMAAVAAVEEVDGVEGGGITGGTNRVCGYQRRMI